MARLLLGLLLAILAGYAMAVEEPEYSVTEQSAPFELRTYQPRIVAEVVVAGSMDEASSMGFRLLANYIFGNNTAGNGGSEKIQMTAPVSMEPRSEKISMTAPVSMQESGGRWRVSFVMPSRYTMETLPRPNNAAVTIRQLPETRYAVIRFSGLAGEQKVAQKTADLLAWLDEKGLRASGEPELARYNPPWTLPFLRRNEVMVEYQ
ncbi:SOUL family heme-binding protein [Microbulbifer marinus]|uniref:SOUL heme-binding protein n=1 Tax=Microbulbifer marinus TaxID=658218 RepID=A0A1H3WV75_9GAMM|nr:heme-binding protein [Microbulbifer marinus]SDZ91039.1 SOUL heme-binding protein [Microbulbifer marinus]